MAQVLIIPRTQQKEYQDSFGSTSIYSISRELSPKKKTPFSSLTFSIRPMLAVRVCGLLHRAYLPKVAFRSSFSNQF